MTADPESNRHVGLIFTTEWLAAKGLLPYGNNFQTFLQPLNCPNVVKISQLQDHHISWSSIRESRVQRSGNWKTTKRQKTVNIKWLWLHGW